MSAPTGVIEDHVFTAACEFGRQSLVFIVPVRLGQLAPEVTSGTIVRSPGGHPVIVTVNHFFDGHEGVVSVGHEHLDTMLEDIEQTRFRYPGDVDVDPDVAVIVPKPPARERLSPFAADWTRIATAADFEWNEARNWGVIVGYAAVLTAVGVNPEKRRGQQTLGSVACQAFWSGRDDRERWALRWQDAAVQSMVADPRGTLSSEARRVAAAKKGENVLLPDPGGMSGGALWAFEPTPPNTRIWNAGLTARFVGIQRGWNPGSRMLAVESPQRYGAWLVETMARVDELLGRASD